MEQEARIDLFEFAGPFKVSEKGLDRNLDRLADLSEELRKKEVEAQSSIKQIRWQGQLDMERIAFGIHLGLEGLNNSIPIEGFDWAEEVERRRQEKYESPQKISDETEEPSAVEAYPDDWIESKGRG